MINFTSNNIKNTLSKKIKYCNVFDMKYKSNETKCIDDFNISKNKLYMHIGDENIQDLELFLESIGSNTKSEIKSMSKIINKILNVLIKGYEAKYFIFEIRVSLPNDMYKIPRWHIDGTFMNSSTTKFITVFKGPGTLSMYENEKASELIKNNYQEYIDESKKAQSNNNYMKIIKKYKKILANKLKKYEFTQLENSQGLIFNLNTHIHAEPNIDTERMVLIFNKVNKQDCNMVKKMLEFKDKNYVIYS